MYRLLDIGFCCSLFRMNRRKSTGTDCALMSKTQGTGEESVQIAYFDEDTAAASKNGRKSSCNNAEARLPL